MRFGRQSEKPADSRNQRVLLNRLPDLRFGEGRSSHCMWPLERAVRGGGQYAVAASAGPAAELFARDSSAWTRLRPRVEPAVGNFEAVAAVAASASTMLMRGSSPEPVRARVPSADANDSSSAQPDEKPSASGHSTPNACDELLGEQPIR